VLDFIEEVKKVEKKLNFFSGINKNDWLCSTKDDNRQCLPDSKNYTQ